MGKARSIASANRKRATLKEKMLAAIDEADKKDGTKAMIEHVAKANVKPKPHLSPEEQEQLEALYGKPGVPSDTIDLFPKDDLNVARIRNDSGKLVNDMAAAANIAAKPPENPPADNATPDVPWKDDPNNPDNTVRRVTVIQDHTLDLPDLYLGVHILGDESEQRAFAKLFVRSRCYSAATLDAADVVVFTGGPDVSPELYGESRHATTWASVERDLADIAAYLYCVENGITMFGVCRGAQFLHVMNRGKLYQDIDNHNGPHSMWDVVGQTKIDRVSSVHHQSCVVNIENGMRLLATAGESGRRWLNAKTYESGPKPDIEGFLYRDTLCIGVQGHPEYHGYNYYSMWCLQLLQKYIIENHDTEWVKGSCRRLKPAFMKARKYTVPQAVLEFVKKNKRKAAK